MKREPSDPLVISHNGIVSKKKKNHHRKTPRTPDLLLPPAPKLGFLSLLRHPRVQNLAEMTQVDRRFFICLQDFPNDDPL